MWILSSFSGEVKYLTQGQSIIVGRNLQEDKDIINISTDKSVSRKHLIITCTQRGLSVEDYKSRYGTFVNLVQIPSEETVILKDGDQLRAGRLQSIWNVKRCNFITCLSGITSFNPGLDADFFTVSPEWTDQCTHLTMNKLELTDKAVAALASRKSIVSPLFWKRCLQMIDTSRPLPLEKDHLPELAESSLDCRTIDFGPLEARSNIFENKKFLFFSKKQLKRHQTAIRAANGTCVHMGNNFRKGELNKSGCIAIRLTGDGDSPDNNNKRAIDAIASFLSDRNLRLIPEAEIALAILHCSTEKFCNPRFSFASVFTTRSADDSIDKRKDIIAPETQDLEFELTLPPDDEDPLKRTAEQSFLSSSPSPVAKKFRTTANSTTITQVSRSSFEDMKTEDDNLFNFLPDAVSEDKIDFPVRKPIIPATQISTPKRKHKENLYSPAKSPKSISPPTKKVKANLSDSFNREWISCATKKESPSAMSPSEVFNEVEDKFGELTIIIPKKLDLSVVPPIPSTSSDSSGRPNFKKFVKVQPLYQNKSIPFKVKLSISDDTVDGSVNNNFGGESSDEEQISFKTLTGVPRHNFGKKVRRL